ncbi:MAG: LysR family transcriptional regulator [Rhodospirillales bacterium]
MNIRFLESFFLLSQNHSFRKVAEIQGTTQPAISARVRSLEEELGVRLYHRDQRSFVLTPEGEEVLKTAASILRDYASLKATFQNAGDIRGTVRLGVVDAVARTWLPDLIRRLREDYPDLIVEMAVDSTETLRQQVRDGRLSLGVGIQPLDEMDTVNRALCQYDMAWVTSPGLLAGRKRISSQDLADLPLIEYAPGSPPGQLQSAYFVEAAATPHHINVSNSMSTMIQLAVAGLGVAAIPPAAIDRHLSTGLLVEMPVVRPFSPITFYLFYKEIPDSQIVRAVAAQTIASADAFALKHPRARVSPDREQATG